MRHILLTDGNVARCDDEDFAELSQYRWSSRAGHDTRYAYRREGSARKMVLMHRQLVGVVGLDVDHRDGFGLNNQKLNLRAATRAQNAANAGAYSTNTSGHKGVSWHRRTSSWLVQVAVNGVKHYGGLFASLDDAIAASKAQRERLQGPFAVDARSR